MRWRIQLSLAATLWGCSPDLDSGGLSDSAFGPQVGFGQAMAPPQDVTEAPPPARVALTSNPLGPAACEQDPERFSSIYSQCPVEPPAVEGCVVEGLECLYPTGQDPVGLSDGGPRDCFAVHVCRLGLWSPLGERCPGPLELFVDFSSAPTPSASASTTASVTPSAAPEPVAPGTTSSPVEPAPNPMIATDGGAPIAEGEPVTSTISDASVSETDAAPSNAGSSDAGVDAAVGAPLELVDAAAVSSDDLASLDDDVILDDLAANEVGAVPWFSSHGLGGDEDASVESDVTTPAPSAPSTETVPECPPLSPVAGAPCEGAQRCQYGQCTDVEALLVVDCSCGRWVSYETGCTAGAHR